MLIHNVQFNCFVRRLFQRSLFFALQRVCFYSCFYENCVCYPNLEKVICACRRILTCKIFMPLEKIETSQMRTRNKIMRSIEKKHSGSFGLRNLCYCGFFKVVLESWILFLRCFTTEVLLATLK